MTAIGRSFLKSPSHLHLELQASLWDTAHQSVAAYSAEASVLPYATAVHHIHLLFHPEVVFYQVVPFPGAGNLGYHPVSYLVVPEYLIAASLARVLDQIHPDIQAASSD